MTSYEDTDRTQRILDELDARVAEARADSKERRQRAIENRWSILFWLTRIGGEGEELSRLAKLDRQMLVDHIESLLRAPYVDKKNDEKNVGPCQGCGVFVHASDALGHADDWLCESCFERVVIGLSVVTIHEGSDWAVVDVHEGEFEYALTDHALACESAARLAREFSCKWFDLSSVLPRNGSPLAPPQPCEEDCS